MNKITSGLRLRMRYQKVVVLQDALKVLLERGAILANNPDARQRLAADLQSERERQFFGKITRRLVQTFQQEHQLQPTGEVDEPTANALNALLHKWGLLSDKPTLEQPRYEVNGMVCLADGSPASKVKVSAFDRDLRSEQLLGQSTTDEKGFYQIRYTPSQFRRVEKGNADLVVKVFAADDSLLVTSPVLFNAPSVAKVDLVIPAEKQRTLTLFERITRELTPLLENIKVEELEEDQKHQDLSFLSGETGFRKDVLAHFAMAHKLAQQSIQPEFWFALLGSSFFQYAENQSLNDQLSAILDSLPSLDAAAVHKALIRAFNQKEIPEVPQEKVASWVEAFLRFIARWSVGDTPRPTFVKLALEHARITSREKQEKFACLFNEHRTLTPELLSTLKKDGSFNKTEIDDLDTSFRLAELIRGDFSIVKCLKEDFEIHQPEKIRTLAKKSETEWVNWVKVKHASGDIKLPIEVSAIADQVKLPEAEVYGKMLECQFREAFPTAAFLGGLERAMANGGLKGLKRPADIQKFLNQHEEFEFLRTPIDEFLETKGLAKDEEFKLELKVVQRVFKLTTTFEATATLLADGLHSAQQIYRMGESEFVRRYADRPGFTKETARLAWNRAYDTHAAMLTMIGDLLEFDAGILPGVLKSSHPALSTFPNWNNLFRTGDLCECEHCRSVLSPTAYFADLLMFLKDRRAKNSQKTVKDILLSRRPDLGWLELSCANALTPLPYIDVVCEVLEDVVAAGENDLEFPGFTTIPSDPVAAKEAVAAVFSSKNISLGDNFSLLQVDPSDPDRWVVHGDDVTYLLKKKETSSNFFAEILRNTKASADELRAYPQYVNPKAYEKLREAKYPLTLPFDLFAEEVRAVFQKSNLERWDLMRTLRSAAVSDNPTEGEIAAEYFGISADPTADFDEKRLILVADATVTGQQAVWGETDASWLNTVSNVKNFLRKTGLEYNDLLALLDLKFINPTGDIAIEHLDSSCDTDKKVIQGLDTAKLDRIHRFLRLWRKLSDWKMWELDYVIRHPSIGNGLLDERFLINLFYSCEVRKKLGRKTTIEQVCGLFGNLNTETRFTKLHEKREDAIYQSLFLNKRLINPLDLAFQLDPSTGDLPAGKSITAHQSVVLAALGIREADLILLKGLTKASDGFPYITDVLTLRNLSFLWRHAWLAKSLKFKIEEWKIVLKLFGQDLFEFADPKAAWEFLEKIEHLKASGFTPDELNWLLTADRLAKAAVKESEAARFLAALRKELQGIQTEYNPEQYDFLAVTRPTDIDSLTGLLTSLLQKLNRTEAEVSFFLAVLHGSVQLKANVQGLPEDFVFPSTITNSIPIQYDKQNQRLLFTGLMTNSQKKTLLTDGSLAAVTSILAYQQAIEELFILPRLAVKFFEPVFTAPLAKLPAAVDFKTLPEALAQKISYDAEQRLLRFAGIMSKDEKGMLDALSADVAYRNAVESLFTQPRTITPPDERIWLTDADLDSTLPDNDTLPKRLANAAQKALSYLSKTLSGNAVVQQASAQLGLTEALTRRLLTYYAVLPDTLMKHLTDFFATRTGVVDYNTLKKTFDSWFWANRVAAIWKRWRITLAELEKLLTLTEGGQLLNFLSLPLDNTNQIASLDCFLRTSRLLRLRDSLPETDITLLEVLEKLSAGTYDTPADFAADVQRLNEAWLAADVEVFTKPLDLAYPSGYLLAERWECLRRAFYFIDSLNASAATVKTFAAPAMNDTHAKTLKELLRSKFGAETWLTLSVEIQDTLRERKRDALAAYLLTQPKPADAPSGKWENMNDLYAYYLLDIEMSSCQLTSRLVQGSGSIQLFVQRCFMGLEPDVVVQADGADGDSAWRWWKWMRKYRVWEANRKVFLWPENWIEPELKKDRSPFFKDLENELLQNEINQYTVESAFLNYLEKLGGVAQLEIAGFYQEDDGDNTILHVFGRTPGAEPHLYYYRRYDYRQWTPWEKVELDIHGDYLIPAVVNKRLFLFWPVFIEVPDETGNSTVSIPQPGQQNYSPPKPKKKLRLQMAISEYRQGKWTPKKISNDFDESSSFEGEITRKHYHFSPIDRSEIDGRFIIYYSGCSVGSNNIPMAYLGGAFEISGCKGVPEKTDFSREIKYIIRPEQASTGPDPTFLKWEELLNRNDKPENDFTLVNDSSIMAEGLLFTSLLSQTPGLFKMSPPWHTSYLDRFLVDIRVDRLDILRVSSKNPLILIGSWLPFFYDDKKRTFFVLPSFKENKIRVRYYYPEIKKAFRKMESFCEEIIQTGLDSINLSTLILDRQEIERFLHQQFPEEPSPPYTDDQVKNLIKRLYMRYIRIWLGLWSLLMFQFRQFHFRNFYHPFVCDFAKLVHNPLKGVPALMSRETQLKNTGFSFLQVYQPTLWVVEPHTENFYPKEIVDFSPDGAYSLYNWELFFHVPLLIANSLSKNQRFEEARDWYHFIFNPIGVESTMPGGSVMSKYWITKPFFETTDPQYVQQRIDKILRMLAGDTSVPDYSAQAKKDLEDQVLDWRTNPFEPHRIANYRTVAYQKTVVMKYLDNLIAWGDYLFRQDTMESINEATQLYILAAEILGPQPKRIPPHTKPLVESFNELEKEFDKFSNALVQVENLVPVMSGRGSNGGDPVPLPMLYFCIPQNDKMLSYWGTVADRLYKIRHGMTIEGVARQLALFEPPIEPGALVKAVSAGVDISSALADLNAPLPLYRFHILLQKANEICNDVKALGTALLLALEKKDTEALNLLRQNQEIRVLEAVKAVREQQIAEAKEILEGLKKSKEMTQIKKQYYESREFMNTEEVVALSLNIASTLLDIPVSVGYMTGGVLKAIPNFLIGASGFGGTPHATAETGGSAFGDAAKFAAEGLAHIARNLDKMASLSSTIASYQRRQEEWDFQKDLAIKEIEQLDKQIVTAELRIAIAEKELENHTLQIENARAVDEFMRSKYTNQELYQWQVGQISGVYFQSYKLAYDLAKRAERCFRFELGLQDSNYIRFGYWDSLKKGLLAGEKLQYDLRRLEAAYLDHNRREFELTKHISLALLDPLALVRLRETGRCFFSLPEEIFDLDYPGHYFRRIKSVSLTLPCVAGPYTSISCTLRLLKNSIRINTANGNNGYRRNTDDRGLPTDDDRFIENNIPVKAIATSSAQNDSGVFELSFRDERYLPFEGAGVISEWSLELFSDLPSNNPDPAKPDFRKPLRQFDYNTISDAILHIKYTAREDAGAFKNSAIKHLRDYFSKEGATHSLRMFNLRQEFPTQWYRFLNPTNPTDENVFELEMAPSLFPFRDVGKTLKVNMIWLLARCIDPVNYTISLVPGPSNSISISLTPSSTYGGLYFDQMDTSAQNIKVVPNEPPVKWQLRTSNAKDKVKDLILVLGYEWEE